VRAIPYFAVQVTLAQLWVCLAMPEISRGRTNEFGDLMAVLDSARSILRTARGSPEAPQPLPPNDVVDRFVLHHDRAMEFSLEVLAGWSGSGCVQKSGTRHGNCSYAACRSRLG